MQQFSVQAKQNKTSALRESREKSEYDLANGEFDLEIVRNRVFGNYDEFDSIKAVPSMHLASIT